MDNFKVTRSVATEVYPRLVACLSPTRMVDRATILAIIDSAVKQRPTDKPPDPEVVVDPSFARELERQSVR